MKYPQIPKENYTYKNVKEALIEAGFSPDIFKSIYKKFPIGGINNKELNEIIKKTSDIQSKLDKLSSNDLLDSINQDYLEIIKKTESKSKKYFNKIKRGIFNFAKGFAGSAQGIISAPFCIPTKIRRLYTGPSNLEKKLFASVDLETGEKTKIENFETIDNECDFGKDDKFYKAGVETSRYIVGFPVVMGIPSLLFALSISNNTFLPMFITLGVTNLVSLVYEAGRRKKTKRQIESNYI